MILSDDIGDEERAMKRPRFGTASLDAIDFWFADGDIILAADRLLFRVHKRVLCQSPIWNHMLETPQSPDGDTYDGLPLVQLYGDSANDWLSFLAWLYDSNLFRTNISDFGRLSGALRLATKYEIPELRIWTASCLSQLWPPLYLLPLHISNIGSLSHAAAAIAIAREADLPRLLPTAFYLLATDDWSNQIGQGNESNLLSSVDLQRLIKGREGLQKLIERFQAGFPETMSWGDHRICRETLEGKWHHCADSNNSLGRFCILSVLHRMVYEDIHMVCDYHVTLHREVARKRMAVFDYGWQFVVKV